jgi:hypothetical protein
MIKINHLKNPPHPNDKSMTKIDKPQKPAPPNDKSPFQIKVDVGYWCGGGGFI